MYFLGRNKSISKYISNKKLIINKENIHHNDNIIFIEIDKIPDTLKNKKIYKILLNNFKKDIKHQIIPFPLDLYKKELIISSLINLIYTIEYVYNTEKVIPIMNYEFALFYKDIIIKYIDYLKKIYPNSIYLREIDVLINSKSLDELYHYIADNNYLNLLKYVIYKKNNIYY